MLVSCNHCGNRVLPKEDETCPACGGKIDPDATLLPPPPPTKVEPDTTGRFLNFLERKSKAGLFLGLALAAYGGFGGSYQRRGHGPVTQGNDLLWVGLILAGIMLLLYLLTRRRA